MLRFSSNLNKKAQAQTVQPIADWVLYLLLALVIGLIIYFFYPLVQKNITSATTTKCKIEQLGITGTCMNQTEAGKLQSELSYTCINDSNQCKDNKKTYCCYSLEELNKKLGGS